MMRMKLKTTVFLLLFVLTTFVLLPAIAQGLAIVPIGNQLYDKAEQLQGIGVVNGRLYLLSDGSLLSWQMGDDAPAILEADSAINQNLSNRWHTTLLVDGEELWRFDSRLGSLQRLLITEEGYSAQPPIQLDWNIFTKDGSLPSRAFLHQDVLWLIAENRDGSTRLLRCQTKQNAKPVAKKVRNLQTLAFGQDGKILALQYDRPSSDKLLGQGKPALQANLGAYDPASDQFHSTSQVDLGAYPSLVGAALLSPNQDGHIYLAVGDRILRVDGEGRAETCALLPSVNFLSDRGIALWAMDEHRLYVAGADQVLIKSNDPQLFASAAQLRISTQFFMGSRLGEFVAMEMGDTALIYNPDQAERTQEQLAAAFLLGEMHSDVLVMEDHSFDLANLGKKGYLLDLSGSQALREYAQSLDPKLQPMLWQDGKLVMVPYYVMLQTPSVHQTALHELGLDIPRDFFALCDLVERFDQENLLDKAPQGLLYTGNYKETLIRWGVEIYIQTISASGASLAFDTPLFHRMMERVQQLDTGSLDTRKPGGGEYRGGEEYPLMSLGDSLSDGWMRQEGSYPRSFGFFALAADANLAPAIPASFTMLAVNSQTTSPAAAIRYLEAAIKTASPHTLAILKPDTHGPIPNPDYLHDLAEEQQRLFLYEETARTARDKRTRESYEAEAQASRLRLQNAETTIRYLEDAQTVAAVREIAQYLLPQTGLMHSQRLALYSPDLVGQYAKGALSLEQFIQQADGKLRLIEMEYQ